MISPPLNQLISKEKFDAVLFGLDGVLTATEKIHATCRKAMFDAFLKKRADQEREPFRSFDITTDYKHYVDGKLRYDGVRSILESHGTDLPPGKPDDPPSHDTICGLGNLKDDLVKEAISGVAAGRAGGFGLVIGVDRKGNAAALMENGADLVITNLAELVA